MKQQLEKGTIFQVVVGVPGPDMATGIVVECLEPGRHRVLTANIIDGSIDEYTSNSTLYTSIPFPGQFRKEDAGRLKEALRNMGGGENG